MQNPAVERRLTICGLTELCAFQDAAVTHVLSILDPGYPEPQDFAAYGPHKRLTLRFDDIIDPAPGLMLPEREHIEELLRFGEGLTRGPTRCATCSFTATPESRAPPPP